MTYIRSLVRCFIKIPHSLFLVSIPVCYLYISYRAYRVYTIVCTWISISSLEEI